MKRPDLDTLACVNAACQLFRRAGASNLVIRKVYGHDHLRLLRCSTCGEEFSARRGTALFKAFRSQPQTVFATKPSCTQLLEHDKLSYAQRGLLMGQDDVTVSCA